VEPDLGFAYMDGVAINDTGFACDVGVGGGWERCWGYGNKTGEVFCLTSAPMEQLSLIA